MPRLYHLNAYTPLRKSLRNNATPAEQQMWKYLRRRQFHGLKFRRQEGIGRYIVDFYCPKKRIAIELDGHGHDGSEQRLYDKEREHFLDECYISVIRFRNEEVLCAIEAVLRRLEVAVLSSTPCGPLPNSGGVVPRAGVGK